MVSKLIKQTQKKAKGPVHRMPAEWLPRLPLEPTLVVAEALRNAFAGKATSANELSSVLGIAPHSRHFTDLISSAVAYGIVNKEATNVYSLSEIGRKIIAPTYEREAAEGKRKAVLNPFVPSIFYSDFDGYPLPPAEVLPSILQTRYEIPPTRVPSAIRVVVDNAIFAGILERSSSGEQIINLSDTSRENTPSLGVGEATKEIVAVSAEPDAIEWSNTCFFITPIGEDDSEIRKHADMMLKHLLTPVLTEFSFEVVRADKIERSGLITQQIFEYLVKSRLCVADLSFSNPNAFYELGVRHICKLPTIQVIKKGDKIPFDVAQGRTITVDTSDIYTIIDRMESAKRELAEHVRHFQSSNFQDSARDNPVQIYLPDLRVTLPK